MKNTRETAHNALIAPERHRRSSLGLRLLEEAELEAVTGGDITFSLSGTAGGGSGPTFSLTMGGSR